MGRKSLNSDPNNRNNYIKAFPTASGQPSAYFVPASTTTASSFRAILRSNTSSLILETPHPILLVIPVGAAGAVHSASADAGVLIARTPGGEFIADANARGSGGGDGGSGVLRGGGGGGGRAGGGGGGLVVEVALSHVLDNGAVNRKLVRRGTRS